jgi:hypothetical protein
MRWHPCVSPLSSPFFCSLKTPYKNEVAVTLNIVCLQETEGRFEVEISSDSVIHLVENLDTNSDTSSQHVAQNGEPLCVANIETVTEVPLICCIESVFNVCKLYCRLYIRPLSLVIFKLKMPQIQQ